MEAPSQPEKKSHTLTSRHAIAQQDTPSFVDIPKSWTGVWAWVAGRWGAAGILALVAFYALDRLYADMKSQGNDNREIMRQQHAEILALTREQVESSSKFATAVNDLTRTVNDLTRTVTEMRTDAMNAHRYQQALNPNK